MREGEGGAEVDLNQEIRKLRTALAAASPNLRHIKNPIVDLDTECHVLMEKYVALVMKQGSDLGTST